MAKQIIQTAENYISIPRVDFINPDFDALVDNKGYDVIWERALPCPCSKRVQHQSVCKNCQGSGWVFINPTQIKAIATSLNKSTQYKEWSMELLGTVSLTVKGKYQLNYMDKITVLNSNSLQSEILLVKNFEENLFCNTIYPITDIIEVFKYEGPYLPLKLLKKTVDYTFSGNKLLFNTIDPETRLETEEAVTITYRHNIQYHVLDLNHDVRNTIILDSSSREKPLILPISAIARRVHNVLEPTNFTGDLLYDNSYTK